jgi:hypothetical protein
MSRIINAILGPRIPTEDLTNRRWRYTLPTAILAIARVCLLISIFLPWWHMELDAPQYPQGLFLTAYVDRLEGDVREIDGLNHYIGMRPLDEAAKYEKAAAVWLIIAMVLLMEAATFIHTRWAVLLAIPAVLFPAGFLLDLQFWMHNFGQNLDPTAALSSSIKPFTPTVLGEGGIGQFKTFADLGQGFYFASACSVLTIIGFVFHRRAYRPLVKQSAQAASLEATCAA